MGEEDAGPLLAPEPSGIIPILPIVGIMGVRERTCSTQTVVEIRECLLIVPVLPMALGKPRKMLSEPEHQPPQPPAQEWEFSLGTLVMPRKLQDRNPADSKILDAYDTWVVTAQAQL